MGRRQRKILARVEYTREFVIFMGGSIIDKIKRGTKNLHIDYYRGADIERMQMYRKIYSKCSQDILADSSGDEEEVFKLT